jgi:hypothetical protein
MKRSVDFLTVALAKQVGPGRQAVAEEEASPMDCSQCPQNGLNPEVN